MYPRAIKVFRKSLEPFRTILDVYTGPVFRIFVVDFASFCAENRKSFFKKKKFARARAKNFLPQNSALSTCQGAQKPRALHLVLHVHIWIFEVRGTFFGLIEKFFFQFFQNWRSNRSARAQKKFSITCRYNVVTDVKFLDHAPNSRWDIFVYFLSLFFPPRYYHQKKKK